MAAPDPGPPNPSPPGRSWVLVVVTVLVVVVLIAPIGYAAVHRIGGGSDSARDGDPTPTATSLSPSASSPTQRPTHGPSHKPSHKPTRTPTGQPTSTPSQTGGPIQCWDGKHAQTQDDCSEPTGRAGLEWVFPSIASQQCAEQKPGADDPDLVLREACHDRLDDGTPVQIGYAQWKSVTGAENYFEAQGLDRTEVTDASGKVVIHQYYGTDAGTQKIVGLYSSEPYSVAVYLPVGIDYHAVIPQIASARPVGQVRGAPTP